ncbi:cytochrome c/c1 heme lyase-domain-containing protein [Sporodiniella umbellata]|nr:cytochrome c/c1 heme lyase-domain-containing protein [Sporodiniella umbellata]
MSESNNEKKQNSTIPPGCPMHEKEKTPSIPPGCPMHKSSELNEKNMMPSLAQTKQEDQSIDLPTERTISSIPKTKGSSDKWEYPSPQQFYNALRRKGWETPEEHIETMVDIHNFLNEEAWNEVIKWEKKYNWIPIYPNFKVDQKNLRQKQDGIHFLAPEEEPGVPVFHLDIRPALDDFESVKVRFKEAAREKLAEWFPSQFE